MLSLRSFFKIIMCALIVATISANNIIGQTGNGVGFGDVEWGRVVESGLVGAVSGFAAGGVGHWAANSSMFINGLSNPLARTLAVAPLASGAGHIAGGTASGLFKGQSINQAFHDSFNGIGKSMLISTGIGVASTIGVSYANGINPITGRAIAAKMNSTISARTIGAARAGFGETLQTGGHTLNKSTLKALGLSKQQGKIAIKGLKKDIGLPPNFHGKIMGNGNLVHPNSGQVLGNLFDYLY